VGARDFDHRLSDFLEHQLGVAHVPENDFGALIHQLFGHRHAFSGINHAGDKLLGFRIHTSLNSIRQFVRMAHHCKLKFFFIRHHRLILSY
jgi:hypothetical protein